jgi:hypothetical protein
MILLIYSTILQAGFSLNRNAADRLILNDNCDEINLRMAELKKWTQSLENRECSFGELKESSSGGNCIVDVSDCLPDYVQKYHGLSPSDSGPNCWNLSLVMAGLLPAIRESSDKEWDFYLSSPLCRELDPNEPLKMGDLGSIEARGEDNKSHIHGFIYVSSEMVYSKNGLSISSPYKLQPLKNMNEVYEIGEMPEGECRYHCGPQTLSKFLNKEEINKYPKGVPGGEICYLELSLDPILTKGCDKLKKYVADHVNACKVCHESSLHYYRCETMDDFIKRSSFSDIESLLKVDSIVTSMECTFQDGLMTGEDSEVYELLTDSIDVLSKYLVNQKWDQTSPNDKLMLTSLALRLRELNGQIYNNMPGSELTKMFNQSIQMLNK